MKKVILCLALFVLTSASASACLNDRELPQHEREFRSQYISPRMTATEPDATRYEFALVAMQVGGAGLLVAAVGITLAQRKAQD